MDVNGFVNIYKPKGVTSNGAVVKVRGIMKRYTGNKKIKVGHIGTLDPGAEGVLVIAIGKAVRLFQILGSKTKEYLATFTFGETTDSLDNETEITISNKKIPTKNEIESILPSFFGEIDQIPPPLSAININGVKAYKLVRHGIIPEMKSRKVRIDYIKIVKQVDKKSFKFEIKCSGGTYMRSIARDIAEKLDTVGYMSALTRIKIGDFDINNSISFNELNEEPAKYIISIDDAIKNFDIPIVDLPENIALHCLNGIPEQCDNLPDELFLVRYQGHIISIGYRTEDGKFALKERLR